MRKTILLLLIISSCREVETKRVLEQPNENVEPTTWIVDSLSLPDCNACEELQIPTNILFVHELTKGDKFILGATKLFHISKSGDTLMKSNYEIEINKLNTYGSDWVNPVDILELNDTALVLGKHQQVVHYPRTKKPQSYFKAFLIKEK